MRKLVIATAGLAAVLAMADPAGAHVAANHGDGAAEWKYDSKADPSPSGGACGLFKDDVLVPDPGNTAMIYNGEFAGNLGSDTGPVVIHYEAKMGESWYANPNGTYAPDPTVKCDGTPGYQIAVTGDITSATISCPVTGTFGRNGSPGIATLSGLCTDGPTRTFTVKSTNYVCAALPPTACTSTDEYQA